MTWAQRQAQTYPDDTGVTARMLTMPVGAPERGAPARRHIARHSPLPGCAACSQTEPCARHASFDLRASLGAAPAEPVSPDELVHDWRPL